MYLLSAIAAIAGAALAVTPASAREGAATPTPSGSAAPAKICMNTTATRDSEVTGSIFKRRICKSRAEWEALGARIERRGDTQN